MTPSKLTKIFSKMMVGSDEVSFSNGPFSGDILPTWSLTVRPWKYTFPIWKIRLPTTIFPETKFVHFLGVSSEQQKTACWDPKPFMPQSLPLPPPFFTHEANLLHTILFGPHFFSDIEELHKIKWDRHSPPPQKRQPFLFSEVVLFKDNQPV